MNAVLLTNDNGQYLLIDPDVVEIEGEPHLRAAEYRYVRAPERTHRPGLFLLDGAEVKKLDGEWKL